MSFYNRAPGQDQRTPPAPFRLAPVPPVFPLPVPAGMQVEVSWIKAPCLSLKPHHPSEFQSPALTHQTLSLPVVETSHPHQTPRSISMHLLNLETLALILSTPMDPWRPRICPRVAHAVHHQILSGHMSGTWVAHSASQSFHLVLNMTNSLLPPCFKSQPIKWLRVTLVVDHPGWTELPLPDLSANQ